MGEIVRSQETPYEAVYAIVFHEDKVLLVQDVPSGQSKKRQKKSPWGFIGGHVEDGESLEETLKREGCEEVGLPIVIYPHKQLIERVTEFDIGNGNCVQANAHLYMAATLIEPHNPNKNYRWFTFNEIRNWHGEAPLQNGVLEAIMFAYEYMHRSKRRAA